MLLQGVVEYAAELQAETQSCAGFAAGRSAKTKDFPTKASVVDPNGQLT